MTSADKILDVSGENFDRKVIQGSHHTPVLTDFWAPWCGPCRALTPMLVKLVEEYRGKLLLAKVNTDEERELATRYGIRSLPTVKLFRDGEVVEEFYGLRQESFVRVMLERHLPRASDEQRQSAEKLRMAGRLEEACEVLRDVLGEDPSNIRVHLDLAQCLLEMEKLAEAEAVLKGLPRAERDHDDARRLKARVHFLRVATGAPQADELQREIHDDPGNCEARYRLSAIRSLSGEYEGALCELLEILRRDRGFRDDAARRDMLMIFDILGGADPLVSRYRSLMSRTLY